MFKQLTNLFAKDELVKVKTVKRTVETRGRKSLSKKQKLLNLLSKGGNVAWTTIQSKFELESPRSMIDTLRAEGYMIYGNRVGGKKSTEWVCLQELSLLLVSKRYTELRSSMTTTRFL